MIVLAFFRWWYTTGWALTFKRAEQRLTAITHAFSVGLLLRTLFAPWRRIVTYPGASLEAHLRAMVDNTVSRFIGFVIRIGVLLTACIAGVGFGLLALIGCILWPLWPLLALMAVVWGIVS